MSYSRSGAVGGRRPRHNDKAVEKLFKLAERAGWCVEMCKSGHFKVWPPEARRPIGVAGSHSRSTHSKIVARDFRKAGLDV